MIQQAKTLHSCSANDYQDSDDDTASSVSGGSSVVGLRMTYAQRARILKRIRRKTRANGFSSSTVSNILDFAKGIDLLLKTIAYEAPKRTHEVRPEIPRSAATPEIKSMSWDHWLSAGYYTDVTQRSHSVIDVLIDEVEIPGGLQIVFNPQDECTQRRHR